jgi:hypothetical protein
MGRLVALNHCLRIWRVQLADREKRRELERLPGGTASGLSAWPLNLETADGKLQDLL